MFRICVWKSKGYKDAHPGWRTPPEFRGNGNFWAGTSYAVINNAEYEADIESVDGQDILALDDEVDFEENDLSLLLGISIPVGTNGSYLNVGYQRSLVEINDALTFNQIFADLSFPLNL